jgi:hypothetical protein
MTTTLLLLTLTSFGGHGAQGTGFMDAKESYPYGSSYFSEFVNASFQSQAGADQFYKWVDQTIPQKYHYPAVGSVKSFANLEQFLDAEKPDIASSTGQARAKKERKLAIWLHRMVKKIMPNFDLDTGFEFKNSVAHGQRQCFLQSVFIASCLQRAGVESGVTMVNRNILGQETNNKHAVCLTRLANGEDVIVDDSEDYAFAKQQGLFANSTSGYKFVKPVYDGDFAIKSFAGYSNGESIPLASVKPMPRAFIASQFDYYRGERTVGGVMYKRKTAVGLQKAGEFLAKSVSEDPSNSLSQYMLGRVFMYRNQMTPAARSLDRALKLYDAQGWIPPDERMAQSKAHRYS